jgi:hypothetical protein
MRHKAIVWVFFAATVLLLTVFLLGALATDRDLDVTTYNVLAERSFTGIIVGRGRVIEDLLYVPLRTAATRLEVQIGPEEFLERKHFRLKTGDKATVIGMPITRNAGIVVLAREVRTANGVLIVRDIMGLPLWEGDRPLQMDPELTIGSSDICGVTE